jgi:hypothetical protein
VSFSWQPASCSNSIHRKWQKYEPCGNFDSKRGLSKIEELIAYFNRTMAKPFRWVVETPHRLSQK